MSTIEHKTINKLYKDCIDTPNLWLNRDVFNLKQISLVTKKVLITNSISKKLRLGKLVERFISLQLQSDDTIEILQENVQIKNEKITVGELDCLMLRNKQPIHLEIVYKFYLYDASVGANELEHWVGPNRKDSLIKKLEKLKKKQFPLLYNKHTKTVLEQSNLNIEAIKQQVCFKAQLYIPFLEEIIDFKLINKACVKGFYLKKEQLHYFKDCSFYLPTKINWLANVNAEVSWQGYSQFSEKLYLQLDKKQSPLCWIKKQNEDLLKCFIVWW